MGVHGNLTLYGAYEENLGTWPKVGGVVVWRHLEVGGHIRLLSRTERSIVAELPCLLMMQVLDSTQALQVLKV